MRCRRRPLEFALRSAVPVLLLGIGGAPKAAAQSAQREFRGAWVATVDNIDWPSKKGLPVAEQQRELTLILDRARAVGLNALIFQVRPACDAMYPSTLEPWAEWLTGSQGQAPDPLWDPLQFAVDGAHARGLELHAWFNPYRARHTKATSPPSADHVAQRTDLCVEYAGYLWLDPGRQEARTHTLRVIADVVARYDVDGVHLDDYFYPYPVKGHPFPDDASFAAAQRRGFVGNRAAWRRHNVDELVAAIGREVHAVKPWVKFGISPFGIARPGVPKGIEAGIDQYESLAADVQGWLAKGWCDYMAPQLYWPIAQTKQSYTTLLAWWPTVNPEHRHLWIGNYTSKVGSKGWPKDELLAQVLCTQGERGATGNIHFSMKALVQDRGGVATALRRGPYAELALVPASPWLDAKPPASPTIEVETVETGGVVVRAQVADDDARFLAVYGGDDGGLRLLDVAAAPRAEFRLGVRPRRIAVTTVDRAGNESPPAR